MTSVDLDLDLDRIAEAATVIDPVFRGTPQYVDEQLAARLGRSVLTKVETLNPLRSFKGRGTDFYARDLPAGSRLVCASAGNFGQGLAYAARKYGHQATVFVRDDTAAVKIARMTQLGATVHRVPDDPRVRVEEFAAANPDTRLVIDGREPAIAEGSGSIGVELLAGGGFDTVVLPVGDAALISGVARWIKAHDPSIRIVGVCAAGAPSMERSWRAGRLVVAEEFDPFAAGIAITRPVPEAVRRLTALADDVVLVDNDAIRAAMALAADTLGVLLEPAGAAGLAAVAVHDLPGEVIATVLTGANADRS
ncbi:threonine ammonia-lyase [Amycolatopsis suaedae]|uniref:Pyridoxal-phosphate dependent enzyme n=1 Tax=Amycolatopsis suaedae TaxID=2510978 RepID=A0A4Q7J836_9PSEU|nr:pyridoxal-phosphate dependent enzyme [Amycolatopsis suaedae]RZQ62972.1 pyridoxal-phosphate dependent enzyme [Amycolatopsis suaedae]